MVDQGRVGTPVAALSHRISEMPAPTPEDADAKYVELKGDESVIPRGMYCYAPLKGTAGDTDGRAIRLCPYWAIDPEKDRRENGYCALLAEGDWESRGLSLLWDQCKECGIDFEPRDAEPEDP